MKRKENERKMKEARERGLGRAQERGKRKKKEEKERETGKGKGKRTGEGKETRGKGRGRFACSITNLRSPTPQINPVRPGPAWGQVPWRHPGAGGRQAQSDPAASTRTWSHPHIPGHRLLRPACPHLPKQLAWT